jgi:uncharacterized protein YqgC (DUF456 family)
MELSVVLTLLLLTAGMIGSIVPMAPGALFSLFAAVVYFFMTDDPNMIFTVFATLTGLFALATDWFAGSIAANYGGASKRTSLMAGLAGVFGFIFLGGPIGLTIAVAATVFFREYLIHGDSDKGIKAAIYATIGVLGSAIIQIILTGSILIGFILTFLI